MKPATITIEVDTSETMLTLTMLQIRLLEQQIASLEREKSELFDLRAGIVAAQFAVEGGADG